MTVIATIRGVPRELIEKSLEMGRLPLSVVQRISGQHSNPTWPPAIAADLVESYIETWAGAIIHDEVLVERGLTRRERVGELRRATTLDAAADAVRESADKQLAEREAELAQQRAAVVNATAAKKATATKQAAARKRASSSAAAKKIMVARKTELNEQEQLEKLERAGTKAALNAEQRALGITRDALDADETVEVIDEAISESAVARENKA